MPVLFADEMSLIIISKNYEELEGYEKLIRI
jgi:hypothetical protein